MKSSYLWAVLVAFLGVGAGHAEDRNWTQSEREREAQQASLWAGKLAEAATLEPDKKFEALRLGLRNMGHRKTIPGHDVEIDRIYNNIQQLFLSLPGHAEYFAELIEKERAAITPERTTSFYDSNRAVYLSTLIHLPSPETVRVLGRYLDDDRDDPGSVWDDRNGMPCSSNAMLAASVLTEMELRGAPFPPKTPFWVIHRDRLAAFREWFAPIKSGENAFSFKGQSVEYRFNPDGTWSITPIANPPDDAPKPDPRTEPPPLAQPGPPPLATPPPLPAKPSGLPWPWLGAGVLAIIAALAALLKSRKASPPPTTQPTPPWTCP